MPQHLIKPNFQLDKSLEDMRFRDLTLRVKNLHTQLKGRAKIA